MYGMEDPQPDGKLRHLELKKGELHLMCIAFGKKVIEER